MNITALVFLFCCFMILFFIISAFFKYLDFLKFKKRLLSNNIEFENRIEELKLELKKYERKVKISSYVFQILNFDFSSNKSLKYNTLDNLFNSFIIPKINENNFFKHNVCLECVELDESNFNNKLMERNECSICKKDTLTINPLIYKSLVNNKHLFNNNYELLNGFDLTFKELSKNTEELNSENKKFVFDIKIKN